MKFDLKRKTQRAEKALADVIINDYGEKQLIILGEGGNDVNSPIKGHLRGPGTLRIYNILKKYKNKSSDILFGSEYKTSKTCSYCFTPLLLTQQPKFRCGLCYNCEPLPDAELAHTVITPTHKKMQKKALKQYAIKVKKDKVPDAKQKIKDRKAEEKVAITVSPNVNKMTKLWDRDINASRNILYIKLQELRNQQVNEAFVRTADNYVDTEDDDDQHEQLAHQTKKIKH